MTPIVVVKTNGAISNQPVAVSRTKIEKALGRRLRMNLVALTQTSRRFSRFHGTSSVVIGFPRGWPEWPRQDAWVHPPVRIRGRFRAHRVSPAGHGAGLAIPVAGDDPYRTPHGDAGAISLGAQCFSGTA